MPSASSGTGRFTAPPNTQAGLLVLEGGAGDNGLASNTDPERSGGRGALGATVLAWLVGVGYVDYRFLDGGLAGGNAGAGNGGKAALVKTDTAAQYTAGGGGGGGGADGLTAASYEGRLHASPHPTEQAGSSANADGTSATGDQVTPKLGGGGGGAGGNYDTPGGNRSAFGLGGGRFENAGVASWGGFAGQSRADGPGSATLAYGTHNGSTPGVQVEWVVADPGGVLQPYIDMVGDAVDLITDTAGALVPPAPSVPNTPSTAEVVELATLLSDEPNSVVLNATPNQRYTYYEVEVPHHAVVMTAMVMGSQGGTAWGGKGGRVTIENIPVTPGETLYVAVGGVIRYHDNPFNYPAGAAWVTRDPANHIANMGDSGIILLAGAGGGGSGNGKLGGDGGSGTADNGEDAAVGRGNRSGWGGNQTLDGRGLMDRRGAAAPHATDLLAGAGGDGWRGGASSAKVQEGDPGVDYWGGAGGGSSYWAAGLAATDSSKGVRTGDGVVVLIFPPDLPPLKPTIVSPVTGTYDNLDGPTGETFEWTYNDANTSLNTQTGWSLYRTAGALTEYWDDTAGAFVPAPVDNIGAITEVNFPEGTWVPGVAYSWAVRVKDGGPNGYADGQWSPWSNEADVIESVSGNPDRAASNYLERALLDHVFNALPYPPPAQTFVAGFVDIANDDGGTEEPLAVRALVSWGPAAGGEVSNDVAFTLTVPAGATFYSLGVFDSLVGGNMLVHTELASPITADRVFGVGDLTVSLS